MAGCAIPTSSAGHTTRRAQADNALTFNPDHSMGAGQSRLDQLRMCQGWRCLEAQQGRQKSDQTAPHHLAAAWKIGRPIEFGKMSSR